MKELMNREYTFNGETFTIGGTILLALGMVGFFMLLGIAGNIDKAAGL